MSGYISIHRKLREHWLYKEDRVFSKFEAWIDIIYDVNHTDNKFLFDGQLLEVKRGSTITSLRKLSEKWKWSITKVNKFLEMLEKDGMLVVKKDTKKTLLTVVNYSLYQSDEWKKEQQSNTEKTQKRHRSNTEVTQKKTNNNELIMTNNDLIMTNNGNKKENIYIEHFQLSLSQDEYNRLCDDLDKNSVDNMIAHIQTLSKDYLKKYGNFNMLIRRWIANNNKNNKNNNKAAKSTELDVNSATYYEDVREKIKRGDYK